MIEPVAPFPRNLTRDKKSGIFKVRKQINGFPRTFSTGEKDETRALRRYYEIMTGLNDDKQHWTKEADVTLAAWWDTYKETYLPLQKSGGRNPVCAMNFMPKKLLNKPLRAFKQTECQAYVALLRQKNLAPSTVFVYTNAISVIFSKAIANKCLKENPWKGVKRGKMATRKRTLTLAEEDRLVPLLKPRDARWFELMIKTGLRITESVTLKQEDMQFERRLMRVVGKGTDEGKERMVPLYPEVVTLLQEQIADGGLWRQTADAVRVRFINYFKAAGIEGVTPHTFRHTFATRFLRGGGDIYMLSRILGHASVKQTEKAYSHLLGADLVIAQDKVVLR